MKNSIIALLIAFSPLCLTAHAQACGGVTESTYMCVGVPAHLSTLLLDADVLKLLSGQAGVSDLASSGTQVEIGLVGSRAIVGNVVDGVVTRAQLSRRRARYIDFFVRIEDYAPLSKFLVSPAFAAAAAKVAAEQGKVTSLYLLGNGQPLVRVNGTAANAYSIVGVANATGEFQVEIRK